jgi:hypothetical protein
VRLITSVKALHCGEQLRQVFGRVGFRDFVLEGRKLNHATWILDARKLEHKADGQQLVVNGLWCGAFCVFKPTLKGKQQILVNLVNEANLPRQPRRKFFKDESVLLNGFSQAFFALRCR